MNNQNIPFSDLKSEMAALQQRSEYYQAKIAALKIQGVADHREEISKLHQLNNECQSAIAFCFSRRQPAI